MVPQLGPEYQHKGTGEPEQGIEHGVLDYGPDTDVFALTLGLVVTPGHLHNVEDGGNDCDAQLDEADDHDGRLEGQSTHGGEAGFPSTHFDY